MNLSHPAHRFFGALSTIYIPIVLGLWTLKAGDNAWREAATGLAPLGQLEVSRSLFYLSEQTELFTVSGWVVLSVVAIALFLSAVRAVQIFRGRREVSLGFLVKVACGLLAGAVFAVVAARFGVRAGAERVHAVYSDFCASRVVCYTPNGGTYVFWDPDAPDRTVTMDLPGGRLVFGSLCPGATLQAAGRGP